MIDEFAVKLPVGEAAEIPVRSSAGLYLYHLTLAAASPVDFPDLAAGRSVKYLNANGEELYARMCCYVGTPWALRKACDADVARVLQQLVTPERQAEGPVNLGW